MLNRLQSLKEGSTSLLDNSMILFGASLKDGNRHDPGGLPIIVPGRHLRAVPKTPLCDFHLATPHRMRIPEKSFDDSTWPLEGLS